jgi:hypothetical protein
MAAWATNVGNEMVWCWCQYWWLWKGKDWSRWWLVCWDEHWCWSAPTRADQHW